MIHQFRDKKQIHRKKKAIRTAAGFGIFLLLCATGLLLWSRGFFNGIASPVWKAQKAITDSIHDVGFLVRTKSSVFHENENLKEENSTLKNSILEYEIVKQENQELKELLGRIPPEYDFTLATILVRPNRSPYDTLIVDAGSAHGIQEGQRVYANAHVPIGEVSKVYLSTSLIMLYSNPGHITEAILESSNATVELVGRGGGNFEMTIPLELSSDKGAFVVLPNALPEIVATVEEVISIPTDPIKKILLSSPVNIQSLKWVQIKKN
jgi:rod shape-determining protein MreC